MEAQKTFEQLVNKLTEEKEVLKDLYRLISLQLNLEGVITLDPAKYSADQYRNILVKREGQREVHSLLISLANGDYKKALENQKKAAKPKIKI